MGKWGRGDGVAAAPMRILPRPSTSIRTPPSSSFLPDENFRKGWRRRDWIWICTCPPNPNKTLAVWLDSQISVQSPCPYSPPSNKPSSFTREGRRRRLEGIWRDHRAAGLDLDLDWNSTGGKEGERDLGRHGACGSHAPHVHGAAAGLPATASSSH
jgi:hypothetical protein